MELLGESTGARPIGLMAGWGRFPIVFAEKARALGQRVVCVGLRGEADGERLERVCHRFHWGRLTRLGQLIRLFKSHGVERLVMAGKVHKSNLLYRPWGIFTLLPDWRALRAFYSHQRRDNADDSLTLTFIGELAKDGLIVTSPFDHCPELLAQPGVLTRRSPTAREEADIAYGWELAREMGRLDVGQSVVVKDRAVIAVEAIEGTDRCIARAGELCRTGGFTVVKVAKPKQDMRFDVPAVGCSTIETIHAAGGRVLAIEAHRTLVLDQPDVVALAERYGISIVARVEPSAAIRPAAA